MGYATSQYLRTELMCLALLLCRCQTPAGVGAPRSLSTEPEPVK